MPEPWGIYLRKSYVADDSDAESIDVQRENDTAYVESRGGYVAEEYVDEGISASKGLDRPSFLRMLSDIDSGKLKRICARDQARISRELIELLVFLQKIEKKKVEVRDSYGREIQNDLQSQIKGMVDADYAKAVGRAVAEKKLYNAKQGKAPFARQRPCGYTKGYASVIPEEKAYLREAREQAVAGMTGYAIVKGLTEKGIKTTTGKDWKTQDLLRTLRRPELAAMKTYKGEVVGQGSWEPIFTKDEHYEVVAALSGKKAFSRNTARKHLLTGILVCALCGVKLSGKSPSYVCNTNRGGCGKVTRNMKAVDDYMIRRAYEYIKKLPKPSEEPKEDLTKVKIAKLEKQLEELQLAKENPDVEMTFADYAQFAASYREQIKALRKTQLKTVPLPVDDAESFIDATVDKQRATISRIYPVVGVRPTGRKGLRFDPDTQLVF